MFPSSPTGGFLLLEADAFTTDAVGGWRFQAESILPGCDPLHSLCNYDARGTGGVWRLVPAPSTLVLLGVGLVGLVLVRRRSQ